MEYSYELKIPKERVAVLIGKQGEVKKQIEELTGTNINIDSREGDCVVSGSDAISLFSVREVIKAISRGFNPDIAKLLLKQDYALEIVSIGEQGKNKTHLKRLKGRIIGSEGKSRRTIEELTETSISVYGKTISIIGQAGNVTNARRAVESLLRGSPHSSVYKFLERKRTQMKKMELLEKKHFG